MPFYHLAGQDIYIPVPFPELEILEKTNKSDEEAFPFAPDLLRDNELISRTKGWVGGAQRFVEVYDTAGGMLLKVEGGGEFFISPRGGVIGKLNPQAELGKLDRGIILGPGLVLALALRGVWSLHASAAMFKEKVIVFLGESGQGKSTLAAYLSQCSGWRLVADDILPVKIDSNEVIVLPHYPQLKLPKNAQPWVGLPEELSLNIIVLLKHARATQMPELDKLSTAQAVESLLGHMAGTRMFNASLLTRHLEFSTQAAKQISAYRLIHPHRRDTLPLVREFLEKTC